MTLVVGNTFSSVPPTTPSSPSLTVEGLFEKTRRPSMALDLPCALLPELQRSKDTGRCLGTEVLGQRQDQLTQTDCVFVENKLLFDVPKIGRARAPLGHPLILRPVSIQYKLGGQEPLQDRSYQ